MIRRMAFLRVVEVIPPSFPVSAANEARINTEERLELFVEEARSIRDLADIIMVANVKDPRLLKLSTLEAAVVLKDRLGVDAAPVIVVRDSNRLGFLSSVLTGISLELRTLMIAWGDSYPASARATNVRDFPSLADAIAQASLIRRKARSSVQFLAPVDVERLAQPSEVVLAKKRLKAGASYLLAQPPTVDAEDTFERHAANLRESGLKNRVLLSVFPFRDAKDVRESEGYFGWKLPKSLHRAAAEGEPSILKMQREVVRRIREEAFPGIYLSTRGRPGIARKLLS
jgi:5,10-methylenetetrahydrofolate reductase